MRRQVTQIALAGLLVLMLASIAAAQQAAQPVVRMGNWIEVGNDVFMHIIGTADIRYRTSQNYDFEDKTRDRVASRNPSSTVPHESESDLSFAEVRLGAEFRYQKNLQLYLLFEHQQVFDGNLIDDRSNTSNPGGTDVFGRAASTENPAFHVERYWIDYKFAGTPIGMRVGADLWSFDQAGTLGDDDPRFVVYGQFGQLYAEAAAVYQFESQRLGLTNDNDFIYYTFKGGYNFKPHKVELGVVYYRDRFTGADTQAATGAVGFRGQRTDAVWINASWSGNVGPIRGLLQGNIVTGTARGGTGVGLPAGVPAGRKYDIFAGGVLAYAEADLGIIRPFVGFVWGSGDGDPRDNKLHGYASQPNNDSTGVTGSGFFNHLETSTAFALRDYTCPGRAQGVRTAAPAGNPYAIGAAVLGGTTASGFTECAHSTSNVWNERLGISSHIGLQGLTYSNPGTWDIPAGIRVFPMKGHEITGWYVYRAVVSSKLLEAAFGPEITAGQISRIRKTLYHEVGGFWQWTLNPHFDIRLAGNVGIPGEGYKDLARLADCNPAVAGRQACSGNDIALAGEARFRARF